MTKPDFTRSAYRELLSAFIDLGYVGRRFDEAHPDRPDLLLRHDIDLWPEAALDVAAIERDLGLTADYFFLMNSPLYAPNEENTVAVFRALLGMGHRIGLHFDAALYDDRLDALNREAARECRALEAVTGEPVTLISFHRPAHALLGLPDPIGGREHTYQPRYFEQIGYCSDSRGKWGHGHPMDHEAVRARRALQLLTHPVWWSTDCGGNREAALAKLVHAKGAESAQGIEQTIPRYCAATGQFRD